MPPVWVGNMELVPTSKTPHPQAQAQSDGGKSTFIVNKRTLNTRKTRIFQLYETQYLHCLNIAVTCRRYTFIVTIKQLIVGATIGSSIVGLMVYRIHKEKMLESHPRVIASLRK